MVSVLIQILHFGKLQSWLAITGPRPSSDARQRTQPTAIARPPTLLTVSYIFACSILFVEFVFRVHSRAAQPTAIACAIEVIIHSC